MWDVRLTHSEFLASIVQRDHGIAFLLTLWLLILLNGVTMRRPERVAVGNECTFGHLVCFMFKLLYFHFVSMSNQD